MTSTRTLLPIDAVLEDLRAKFTQHPMLILEAAPASLRASAMAGSIFIIHLFGDLWSPGIVGALSDHWASLAKGLLILPAVLLLAGVLWGLLAWLQHRAPATPVTDS